MYNTSHNDCSLILLKQQENDIIYVMFLEYYFNFNLKLYKAYIYSCNFLFLFIINTIHTLQHIKLYNIFFYIINKIQTHLTFHAK